MASELAKIKNRERVAKWRKENPEKVKQYRIKYEENNKEKRRASKAKYDKEKRDSKRTSEAQAKWKKANPGKVKAYIKKYYESEKGKASLKRGAKRYAEKMRNDPEAIARRIEWQKQLDVWASTREERRKERIRKETERRSLKRKEVREMAILAGKPMRPLRLTDEQRKEAKRIARRNYKDRANAAEGKISRGRVTLLLELQKCKCPVCKRKLVLTGGNKYHIDHIIPLAKGGSNHDHNIQLLCRDCNQAKQDIHPVEFMGANGFLL